MIESTEKHTIDYIDASSISCFNRCPARYYFERILGLKLPEDNLIAPDFGTCIHFALPHCYNGSANIDKAIQAFKDAWATYPYGDDLDDKRNTNRAIAILQDFARSHTPHNCPYDILPLDGITTVNAEKISDNEVPFMIDIGGPLPAAGRIDLPILWRSTKRKWVCDYKTSQEISARLMDGFDCCPQSILYTVAGSHLFGERIDGMVIEALRVSKTNTETQAAFCFVPDNVIRSFLRFTNATAESILECNDKMIWPKKWTSCSPYSSYGFPSRSCIYKPLCKATDWQSTARTFKKTPPFHPLKVKIGGNDSD